MGKIIAISNQKGGVGKTTSAINLSAQLAQMGRRVLLIDFDPQGNATSGIGVEIAEEGKDLFDMFFGKVSLSSIIRPSAMDKLKVAPSSKDLVAVEVEMGKTPGRELILKTQLRLLRQEFDYTIIDCPPSLGILTLNALSAADAILVPLQAEYYALEGVSALMNTIEFVKQTVNPQLQILGVFMTMFDARTNLAGQVYTEAKNYFNELMFTSVIPRSVKLSEAPSHGLPICLYDPTGIGARAYDRLAKEVDKRVFEQTDNKLAANG
jgi:chromosome partitioning protein